MSVCTRTWERALSARLSRVASVALILLGAAAVLQLAVSTDAEALPTPTRSGDLQVLSLTDAGRTVADGGSSTTFVIKLPDGAACPGDSANDDYRVQGFLVPRGVDPAKITYNSIGPVGANQIALYKTDTDAFVHAFTEPNETTGQPGLIPAIPPLTFGDYAPDAVAPGHYTVGIACTYFGTTTNYWDVPMDIASDLNDEPAHIHWTVVGGAPAGSSSGSSSGFVAMGLVALLLVGGLVAAYLFVVRRSSDGRRISSKGELR